MTVGPKVLLVSELVLRQQRPFNQEAGDGQRKVEANGCTQCCVFA